MARNISSIWSTTSPKAPLTNLWNGPDMDNSVGQSQSSSWEISSDSNAASSIWAKPQVDASPSARDEMEPLFPATEAKELSIEKSPADSSSLLVSSINSNSIEGDNAPFNGVGDAPSAGDLLSTEQSHSPTDRAVVNRFMTSPEILKVLTNHGCPDLTDSLDMSTSSIWPISNGGFGDVYKARLYDSTEVAIKTTRIDVGSEGATKHLKHTARELYTWAQCNHQNVVRLLGLAVFRDQIGMVSMWMPNGNLPSYLSRNRHANRWEISKQISAGLSYLHTNNIVHGDLKGANVLISSDGTPALTDFGNSVLANATLGFTASTSRANISLRWTAPEILDSEVSRPYTKAADVYALGMTILEAMTGAVPYEGKSEHSVMFCVWQNKYPARPEVICSGGRREDMLWSLLIACWAREPTHRPAAAEVIQTLSAALDDEVL